MHAVQLATVLTFAVAVCLLTMSFVHSLSHHFPSIAFGSRAGLTLLPLVAYVTFVIPNRKMTNHIGDYVAIKCRLYPITWLRFLYCPNLRFYVSADLISTRRRSLWPLILSEP